jgi:hypothetical protein
MKVTACHFQLRELAFDRRRWLYACWEIAMFRAEEILNRLKKSPFTPLRIKITSGEEFEIRHPDLVLVGERDLTVGTASKRNPAMYHSQTRIAIMHITMLEDLPASVSNPPTNGH